MFRDLRLGMRTLMQAKGWTAVILLSLALGIGANTALFSSVNGLLLRKLPVRDPDTLVRLKWAGPNDMMTDHSEYGFSSSDAAGRDVRSTFSYPMFQQFVADNRTLTDLFACAPFGRVNLVVDGQADTATAFISTGNYYRVLGVTTRAGRTLGADDDRPAAPPAAVISHRYWQSRFGGDIAAVGKVVRINDVAVTIVGVLSPEFTGVQQAVSDGYDVGIPLALDSQLNPGEERLSKPTYWWLLVMGRLQPGVTVEQAQANLEGTFRHTARAGLDSYLRSLSDTERATSRNRTRVDVPHLVVDSGSRGVYDPRPNDVRAATILSVVVALVLLIVCANVANLLLSRAVTRQKEISVRLSLGATRARVIRQLLTESLLLASLGGVLGAAVGYGGRYLLPRAPGQLPPPLDWRVMLFVVAVTAATGIVFGIAPALRATGLNVSSALKESSRTIAGSRTLLGRSLLALQVAISLVLLIGAGLFLRTVGNLRSVNVGFNPHNLVLFRVDPRLNRYDEARRAALYDNIIDRLRTVPGVRGVAASSPSLLSGSVSSTGMYVQGRTYPPGRRGPDINRVVVSPAFFEVMEIPLLAGRGLTARDHQSAPKVAVINEAAALKYFPGENPIGRRFGTGPETSGEVEIVGVLRDVKYNSIREPAPPTMYVPYLQQRVPPAVFEVRTATDPLSAIGAIREAVRQVDPNLPLMNVSTQMEQIELRFQQEKIFARAYILFGGLALLVAAVGLFGLMSYSVSRRTNEIGVRMALGAERADVLRLVMRESMVLVLVGIVVGVGVAIAAGRLVATLLFGLSPTDATTMAVAATVMVAVSAVAGYVPARRASRVDPMVALRYE